MKPTLTHRLSCPECRSTVRRVPRLWLDRLASLFVPALRYQCTDLLHCAWEGRLKGSRHAGDGSQQHRLSSSYVPRRILDSASGPTGRTQPLPPPVARS